MRLVDSHCHIDYPALVKDRDGVVERARAAGVCRMVNISTTRRDYDTVRQTAEHYEDVFCTVGVHPHHVHEEGEQLSAEDLIGFAEHPKVVGIGETGLDYFYKTAPVEAQHDSFRRHLRASAATGLPVIVHSRDAEEDTIRLLQEEYAASNGRLTGVLHCFSSRRILAEEALKLGFYVSLSGILTFKKSEELRSIAKDVPVDRLLVETDSPFLAPEPYRGKICEPAYVTQTAKVLAEIKNTSADAIAEQTTENFFRLFNKVTRPS
ncbi:MAG: TatD family hydrolase [Alphaproteobacteria bacterium]|nr:TatD family hydrolase [Alphaproteobacteria bacterium]MBV8549422.1 TatD family hydrolase [Alphaproteobacteria bacterium]